METEPITAAQFGEILCRAREEAGLSRAQVAKSIGRGASSIRNYETGSSMPDPATIHKLGQLLELPASVVERAQAESQQRRAHHEFMGCPPRPGGNFQTQRASQPRSCGLSSTDQIAAIAWEARRTGSTFDAVRQLVDSQGGGDIYRRFIAFRREKRAAARRGRKAHRQEREDLM